MDLAACAAVLTPSDTSLGIGPSQFRNRRTTKNRMKTRLAVPAKASLLPAFNGGFHGPRRLRSRVNPIGDVAGNRPIPVPKPSDHQKQNEDAVGRPCESKFAPRLQRRVPWTSPLAQPC